MRRLILFHLLLLTNVCHFACSQETKKSKPDSSAAAKPAIADSTESYEINASGDSVPYSKTYYYVEGMKRYGLAFELVNLFEQELNKQLKYYPPKIRVIFIPVSRKHILPLLMGGHADMIASGFTITPEREKLVDFSSPTVTGIKDVVVGGPGAPPVHSIADLA